MVVGIEHIAIYTKNVSGLARWYADFFGGRIVFDNGKGCCFVAFSDNSMIEFCDSARPEYEDIYFDKPGMRHLAFTSDNFYEDVSKVRAAKVTIIREPSIGEGGVKTMFFADPEGNILHLISREKHLV